MIDARQIREARPQVEGGAGSIAVENRALLAAALADRRTGWSMGSFGAIAEFHTDAAEPAVIDRPEELVFATRLGAIAFVPAIMGRMTPIAYEALTPDPRRWSQGIALCLDQDAARRNRRFALTELGSDADAILPEHRGDLLFDLGLGLPQADFCIRTADPELIDILCSCEGRSLFDPNNPAMAEILNRHPHRAVLTNVGRIEVFQKIGGPETGGISPAGPHTHLLPKLLGSGRTYSANVPIPPGLIPCGYIHPAHPASGPLGEDIAFDPAAHDGFQSVLLAFGTPAQIEAKERLRQAIETGMDPRGFRLPASRHGRAAARVLLRQLRHLEGHRDDAALDGWEALFETRGISADQDEGEIHRH
ncbi:MAG: hypothetical protein AB7S92_14815 [Parvibaculaceae bacterium]